MTYYTLDEAAALLKVHPQILRRWIREGRLPARRFGKQYRLDLEDVERAAETVLSVRAARRDDELDEFDRLSLAALHDLWDNEEDAIYDDWRELYGVQKRWRSAGALSSRRPHNHQNSPCRYRQQRYLHDSRGTPARRGHL